MSYSQLTRLVKDQVIQNVNPDYINSASIDITLGPRILSEMPLLFDKRIELSRRQPLEMMEHSCEDGFALNPGRFILAQSEQVFNLPNWISAEYKLKSSMARIGLNHALAGWCDAGWNGSVLTLELMNVTSNHTIVLKRGDRIGQMIFFSHQPVPEDKSYAARGRYNNDDTVKGVKL